MMTSVLYVLNNDIQFVFGCVHSLAGSRNLEEEEAYI